MSVEYTRTRDGGVVNVSWTATITMGVDQTYIIVLDTVLFETTHLYYSFEANISAATCSAYVIAVNRAGESDPSNNVSIPSLPDIGPVTASLTHQVYVET